MIRTVSATRYVTPLRQGGSLPALVEADAAVKPKLTPDVIDGIVSLIPDVWLDDGVPFDTPTETRQAYTQWLLSRLDASQLFVEEAQNARPKFV